ncbi:MAG: hypothetical protein GXO28_05070 [Methanopyri archaeon]|nr:hypothetical protein [Methanopyri archaeon]
MVQGITGKAGAGYGKHYRHGGATTLPSSLRYGGYEAGALGVTGVGQAVHP